MHVIYAFAMAMCVFDCAARREITAQSLETTREEMAPTKKTELGAGKKLRFRKHDREFEDIKNTLSSRARRKKNDDEPQTLEM